MASVPWLPARAPLSSRSNTHLHRHILQHVWACTLTPTRCLPAELYMRDRNQVAVSGRRLQQSGVCDVGGPCGNGALCTWWVALALKARCFAPFSCSSTPWHAALRLLLLRSPCSPSATPACSCPDGMTQCGSSRVCQVWRHSWLWPRIQAGGLGRAAHYDILN